MSDTRSWGDADAACQAAGLQLASVQSAEQNALLLTVAGDTEVWIGGTDAASEGTWVWSPSNAPLSYANWGKDEPNNNNYGDNGEEDCLVMEVNSRGQLGGPGKWNDLRCTILRKYVCQTACPVPPSPPPSPSPSSPGTFMIKASLMTAVQTYNTNPTTAIATYGPIADWDVSAITDMKDLFRHEPPLQNFNADISNWDTSSVTNMNHMFWVRSTQALAPEP